MKRTITRPGLAVPGLDLEAVAAGALPWAAFAAFIFWAWGLRDLAHTLPFYGDFLEHIAGMEWFGEAMRSGQNFLVYPLNFFPEGWQLGAHPGGAILYPVLWPLARLFGTAAALNLGMLLACAVAFRGVQLLARPYLGPLPATVAALAFTFWPLRWHMVTDGLFNIQVAAALLPWLAWCADRSLASRRRRWAWLACGGLLWAFAIMASMYFAFVGGIVVAAWFAFSRAGGPLRLTRRGLWFAAFSGLALAFSLPWLVVNWRANAVTNPDFYKISEVVLGGTSLNALFSPGLHSPWLGWLAGLIYHGAAYEQAMANFGLVGLSLALAGGVLAWRDRAWRPALALALAGVVLALGLTLQWDGRALQWPALRPLNDLLWQLGHRVKPAFFAGAQPQPPFADAVPLPSLLLTAVAPLWERGRQLVRYGLGAGLGVYLLAGLALARLRRPWLRYLLAGLLLFEILPPRLEAQPFPPQVHPAFAWLSGQQLAGQGIVDLVAGHPFTPVLATGGAELLATRYHRQATVAGASGVTPRHHAFLGGWLAAREHSYWDPDFAAILRAYRVKYILLHMQGPWEQGIWREMQAARGLRPLQCFAPAAQPGPWPWPICVAEVLPAASPDFNLLLHEGWSGMEQWGVWAEGTTSYAQFVSTARVPYRLSLGVFPQCVPDQKQQLSVEVGGRVLATHQWQDCEPWAATLDVPVDLVHVGANDVVLRSAYAVTPAGAADSRRLSVGYSKLYAARAAP